jgi:hypothetical protein
MVLKGRLALRVAGLACALLAGCAAPAPRVDGLDLAVLPSHGAVTALVFFSPACHCLAVHDPRLVALYEAYHPRGLALLLVDSETSGSPERDDAEARRRAYPFPIVRDPGAKIAAALGAQYATYSVVLDAEGRVRYHGGIDSDKNHLHSDAQPYLSDAIRDLLEGRPPRVPSTEALGCALQTW